MIKRNIYRILVIFILIIGITSFVVIHNNSKYIKLDKDSVVNISNEKLTITNAQNKNLNIIRNIDKNSKIIILKNNTQIYSCSSNKKQDLMFNDDNLKLEIK